MFIIKGQAGRHQHREQYQSNPSHKKAFRDTSRNPSSIRFITTSRLKARLMTNKDDRVLNVTTAGPSTTRRPARPCIAAGKHFTL